MWIYMSEMILITIYKVVGFFCKWLTIILSLMSMTSQQSFDNNSLNDDFDQEQSCRNRYKKEANEALNSVDYRNFQVRKLLSNSYRKLSQQLSKVELDRFNLDDSEDMIDEITKSAYFFQPYKIQDYQFKFFSSICKEATRGGRKCKEPLIKIDHSIVHFEGKSQKIIIKDKPFLLVIQSQPNSTIIYTNKPRTHPLLIFTEQECGTYFKKRMNEKCSQMLTPPCDLSIVVIKEPFKVQSKLIYLKIISNQSEQIKNKMYEMGWAIRPEESFNYEDSASGNASSYIMNQESF